MRPGLRLLYLALALTAVSFLTVLFNPDLSRLLVPVWALLAIASLVDAALTLPPRALRLALEAPATGYAGQTAQLTLVAEAARPLPKVAFALDLDPGLETERRFDHAGEATRIDLPVTFTRRGKHALRGVQVLWSSRFGLWEMLARRDLNQMISVVPDISPVTSGQIAVQMLPLTDGMKEMRLRGEGSEFHQLREFQPGMDPRTIDWKRSARMRGLVARETRAEKNHQIILGIDSGHLMAERIDGLPKLDRAIHASLAMAWAAGLGGDQVGFFSFDSRPRLWLPPSPGRTAFSRIQAVAAGMDYEAAETNHTLALTHLMGKLKRRSLVILFSDFTDSTTAELLVENTGILARHHLVLYVALRDPALQSLAQPDAVDINSVARSVAAGHLQKERAMVLDRLHRLGVLCLDATPGTLTPALVSRYIDIKSRELI
jgi:uncharacterized protein (DUF58 family)